MNRLRIGLAGLLALALVVAVVLVQSYEPPERKNGSYLTVLGRYLVFTQGKGGLAVRTDAPEINWTVRDDEGRVAGSGTADVVGSEGQISLAELGPGYYIADLVGGVSPAAQRRVGVAILTPLPNVTPRPASSIGVGMHFWDASNEAVLSAVRDVGFGHVRFDVNWDEVEKKQGRYEFSARDDQFVERLRSDGVEVLPIAAYRNPLYDDNRMPSSAEGIEAFARFAGEVAKHFDAEAVEIYNEPNKEEFNDSACGLEAGCYLDLLGPASDAVRASTGHTRVVGPAVSEEDNTWLGQFLQLGALVRVDALSLHPYRHPSPPEGLIAQLDDVADRINYHNNGQDIPIWVTELGWPTNVNGGSSEFEQSNYLVRAEVLAIARGVDRLYWYNFLDDGTDQGSDPNNKEHNFGLLRRPSPGVLAASPKPALVAQAVLIRQLWGASFSGVDEVPAPVHSYRFEANGSTTRVMWSSDERPVTLMGSNELKAVDAYGREIGLSADGQLTVSLSERPIFVHGNASVVNVPQ